MKLEDIPEMRWDDWPQHPNWLTEKQHREKHLIPVGDPVARVWYSNKYMRKRGEDPIWLLLFDVTLATPKVVDEKKRAALARGKETAARNRICPYCGQDRGYKPALSDRYNVVMCKVCWERQTMITEAREWLRPGVFVLDTETTGFQPGHILSIVIRDTCNRVWADWLIKPDEPINESGKAYQVNGISNEMVRNAPSFADVWPEMHSWLRGNTVLAYNVAFDRMFVEHVAYRHKLPYEGISWTCVMEWYAEYEGPYRYARVGRRNRSWVSLGAAAQAEGVSLGEAHTAGGDTETTVNLIRAIAAKCAPLDPKESV